MRNKSGNALLLAVGIAIGLSRGLAHGVLAEKPAAPGADLPWQDARMLAAVLERVKHDYVNPVDDHQLLQAAIRGMVASLDPYSAYLDGDEYDEVKISSSGRYTGVGIDLSIEDDQVVVIAPFDGSPAAQAGIRSGDIIVTIDGIPVNTNSLADTIGRMRGAEGTSVKIGIMREGNPEPMLFTLKRARVDLHSVRGEMLEPGLAYVRISQFSETTGDDLNASLKDLRKHNGAPIVVLVNGGSASAAEIVAGALKDQHRAKLMGRTTFGKGSVQTIIPLSDDRAVKLTTSLYYTPSGVSINHRGIAPDIELERDPKPPAIPVPEGAPLQQRDVEVKRALEELKVSPSTRPGAVTTAARL
jgi:carboxyl-terminal processing protease